LNFSILVKIMIYKLHIDDMASFLEELRVL